MPLFGMDEPSVCVAASDELERSYFSLSEFETLLHAPLLPGTAGGFTLGTPTIRARSARGKVEARGELERLALVWGEAARRAGRRLSFEWHGPEGGVGIVGTRRLFAEAIANLLANAIRHGEGDIAVVARADAGVLRVEVRDEGPGLARPVASLACGRRLGPHGHGLAVAVRAAQRLGGSVTSAPSARGAVLVVCVPATPLALPKPSPPDEEGAEVAQFVRPAGVPDGRE
jgi:hypothetical protein